MNQGMVKADQERLRAQLECANLTQPLGRTIRH